MINPLALFGLPKIVSQIGIVFIILAVIGVLFGTYSCNQKRKEKALIEHNTKQKEEKVKEEKDRIKVYTDKERFRIKNEEVKLHLYRQLYLDKNCVLEQQAMCADKASKECDLAITTACNRKSLPELTIEEVEKKKRQHFLNLQQLGR